MFYLLLILTLCLPSAVLAQTAVLGQSANPLDAVLYDYRAQVQFQEEFIGGNSSSTTIGTHNWSTSGGTNSIPAPEASHPGIIRRDTSSSSGTATYLFLGTATRNFLASESFSMTWVFRLNQTDANTKVRVGAMNSVADPSTSGVYIEKLDADTNWFCVTRSASTETPRTDSGVATGTGWVRLEIKKTSAGVSWIINGSPVCGVVATNVPTAAQIPIAFIINSAVASKTMDIDYFGFKITGISR